MRWSTIAHRDEERPHISIVAVAGGTSALTSRVRERLAASPGIELDTPSAAGDLDVLVLAELGDVGTVSSCVLAAVARGAQAVVACSSALVYGAHPDNDLPLHEESPLRPPVAFPAAQRHLAAETWLRGWTAEHPEVTVAVLRPAMIVDLEAPPLLVDAFVAGRVLAVKGHRPPLQFVHPDDVAAAVVHAAVHRLEGFYNVASEGWLSADEVDAILGRARLEVPEELIFGSLERLRLAGLSRLPSGAIHHLMHPWVVSVDRLVATGWRPAHRNRDALAELAAVHRHRVVLGPVTITRRRMRQAAGTAVGVAGGLIALGTLARRHRADSP